MRWWAPPGPGPVDLSLLTPGPDPAKDLGLSLLIAHRAGAAACLDAARTPLADEHTLVAKLAHMRSEVAPPLVQTVSKAVGGEAYAGLLARDLFDEAEASAVRLFRACVAKGVTPTLALERTAAVYGVPFEELGRYLAVATTPVVAPAVLTDAADRALLTHVAKVVAAEHVPVKEEVSKAPAVLERPQTRTDDPATSYYDARDTRGRFTADPATETAFQALIAPLVGKPATDATAAPRVGRQARTARRARQLVRGTTKPATQAAQGRLAEGKLKGAVLTEAQLKNAPLLAGILTPPLPPPAEPPKTGGGRGGDDYQPLPDAQPLGLALAIPVTQQDFSSQIISRRDRETGDVIVKAGDLLKLAKGFRPEPYESDAAMGMDHGEDWEDPYEANVVQMASQQLGYDVEQEREAEVIPVPSGDLALLLGHEERGDARAQLDEVNRIKRDLLGAKLREIGDSRLRLAEETQNAFLARLSGSGELVLVWDPPRVESGRLYNDKDQRGLGLLGDVVLEDPIGLTQNEGRGSHVQYLVDPSAEYRLIRGFGSDPGMRGLPESFYSPRARSRRTVFRFERVDVQKRSRVLKAVAVLERPQARVDDPATAYYDARDVTGRFTALTEQLYAAPPDQATRAPRTARQTRRARSVVRAKSPDLQTVAAGPLSQARLAEGELTPAALRPSQLAEARGKPPPLKPRGSGGGGDYDPEREWMPDEGEEYAVFEADEWSQILLPSTERMGAQNYVTNLGARGLLEKFRHKETVPLYQELILRTDADIADDLGNIPMRSVQSLTNVAYSDGWGQTGYESFRDDITSLIKRNPSIRYIEVSFKRTASGDLLATVRHNAIASPPRRVVHLPPETQHLNVPLRLVEVGRRRTLPLAALDAELRQTWIDRGAAEPGKQRVTGLPLPVPEVEYWELQPADLDRDAW